MEHRGCQEGKMTPKMIEILCPKCGADMEIFAYMGGSVELTGRVVSDEKCTKCGYVIEAGRRSSEFEQA